jgi:glycyl-tRNA synthetase
VDLIAREILPEPVVEEFVAAKLVKKLLGAFKADTPVVNAYCEEMATQREEEALALNARLQAEGKVDVTLANGNVVTLTKEMVTFSRETRRVSERKYVPNVIEPSFGIGRIITGVWEHIYYARGTADGEDSRAVLAFNPAVAPFKAVILPLDARIDRAVGARIAQSLSSSGLAAYVDESTASVGKRYARADEIGTPFAVTVDFDTTADAAVTLRERDSTGQVRLPIADVHKTVRALVEGAETWAEVVARYGLLTAAAAE